MEVIRQIGRLFGYKNRQYETLTEVNTQGWKVRIWREAKSLEEAEQFDHASLQARMLAICETLDRKAWHADLMKLPKVACVAIVDAQGNGVSGYPDWY